MNGSPESSFDSTSAPTAKEAASEKSSMALIMVQTRSNPLLATPQAQQSQQSYMAEIVRVCMEAAKNIYNEPAQMTAAGLVAAATFLASQMPVAQAQGMGNSTAGNSTNPNPPWTPCQPGQPGCHNVSPPSGSDWKDNPWTYIGGTGIAVIILIVLVALAVYGYRRFTNKDPLRQPLVGNDSNRHTGVSLVDDSTGENPANPLNGGIVNADMAESACCPNPFRKCFGYERV